MFSLSCCKCEKDHGTVSSSEPIKLDTASGVKVYPLGLRFEKEWINFGFCKHCNKAKLSKEEAKIVLWDAIEKRQKEKGFLTGREIKAFRQQANMKVQDLANLTQMNRSVLSATENGYHIQTAMNEDILRTKIAEYLKKHDPVKRRLKKVFSFLIDQVQTSKIFLNKMMFYVDFLNYKQSKQSLTGSEYVPMQYGPCPKDYQEILQEMITDGEITALEGHKFSVDKTPDMSEFSAEEMESINDIIKLAKNDKGRKLFQLSHKEKGFKETPMMQPISYEKYAKDLKIEELLNEIAETG